MNNSLKHVISVDDGLAKFYGLSIWRVVDCSNTSVMFGECILVNNNTYNNSNYKYINNNGDYKYINDNGNYKYINNNVNYKYINNNGNYKYISNSGNYKYISNNGKGNGKIW